MVGVLLFALLSQGTLASDTIDYSVVRGEYASVFNVLAVPPPSPQSLAIVVRKSPEGSYLAAFQREHPWILTYLVQRGLGFDLAEIVSQEGDWDERVSAARLALEQDSSLESHIRPILGAFLEQRDLVLDGYRPRSHRPAIPLFELEALAARYLYPDGVSQDGTIQVHICTNFNAGSELPLSENLLASAFVFSAVRAHLDDIMPELEEAMDMAKDMAKASDPATTIARAQGVLWSHLIRSGALREALLAEAEASAGVFPFELQMDEGVLRGDSTGRGEAQNGPGSPVLKH